MSEIISQFGQNIGKTGITVGNIGDFNISSITPNTTLINWVGVADGSLKSISGAQPFHTLTILNNSPNNNSLLTIDQNSSSDILINHLSANNSIGSKIELARYESITLTYINNAWIVVSGQYPEYIITSNNDAGYCPWWSGTTSTLTSNLSAANNYRLFCSINRKPLVCRNMSIEITTGAADTFLQVRIFGDNSTASQMNTLSSIITKSNLIDCSTAGIKTVTFDNPVILPKGVFWYGILRDITNSASISYRGLLSTVGWNSSSHLVQGSSSFFMQSSSITADFNSNTTGSTSNIVFNTNPLLPKINFF